MARVIDTLVLKTSVDSGTTWVDHKVLETPTIVPETVSEEESTDFGMEYKDYLPTVKDRELFVIKVRQDGDAAAEGLARGCVLKFRLVVTYSDKACSSPSIVSKDREFTAYIQKRESDTVDVKGIRTAAISLSLRLKTAMTDYVAPVGP